MKQQQELVVITKNLRLVIIAPCFSTGLRSPTMNSMSLVYEASRCLA